MGRKKELSGLPNTLEQRFFSNLFFTNSKGMADWIWNGAVELGTPNVEIDILRKKVVPTQLEIKEITSHLPRLWVTIEEALDREGFSRDHIVDAKFDIHVSKKYQTQKILACMTTVRDSDGHEYKGKWYTERAVQEFTVFKDRTYYLNRLKRVFNIFKGKNKKGSAQH